MALFDLTRRKILKTGLGGAAVAAMPFVSGGLLPRAARAFEIGDGVLSIVSDGNLVLPMSFAYPDVPQAELGALLAANDLPAGSLVPDCNVPVLRSGDQVILFDVGAGPNFMPSAGKLGENLAQAGLDPADVTDVIFTHAHPDHLWGLIDDFDELVFANAAYHMGRAEWDYWWDPATVSAMPEARQSFAVGARNRMEFIEDRVNLFEPGAEVVTGVEAVDTSGHTPGHMSFMLHGGADPVLVAGDAISHHVVSFAHPKWPSGSDQDPEKGIATRLSLLDRLASDKSLLAAYHLPEPGKGRVERDGSVFRFVASS